MNWNINNQICLRCGGCVSVCPQAALELKDTIIYQKEICKFCAVCQQACPVGAIEVKKND